MLTCIADWAEAVELARAGTPGRSLDNVTRIASELEAHADAYTGARLLTDFLPLLDGSNGRSAAAGVAERLETMGARASAQEAHRICDAG